MIRIDGIVDKLMQWMRIRWFEDSAADDAAPCVGGIVAGGE